MIDSLLLLSGFIPMLCGIVMTICSIVMYVRSKKTGAAVMAIGFAMNSISNIGSLTIAVLITNQLLAPSEVTTSFAQLFAYTVYAGVVTAAVGFTIFTRQFGGDVHET